MNINKEAVGAAARALFEANYPKSEREVWGVPAIRDHYTQLAKASLSAAAPHLSVDVVEEWAVRFLNVRKAEDKSDAEQKVRDIRKGIQDGTESPHLPPPHIIHRYRVNETELTPWKPTK